MAEHPFTDRVALDFLLVFLGFVLGLLCSFLTHELVSKWQGRSKKKEIELLVQQFQEHFRYIKENEEESEDSF